MTENTHNTHKLTAGISEDIFSVLIREDQTFLTMLDKAGINLESIYEKIKE